MTSLFQTIGLTFCFVVAFGALILLVDLLLRRERAKRYRPEERFQAGITINMHILAALGFERRMNETISEFRSRIRNDMNREEDEDGLQLMSLIFYEEYLYSQNPVRQEMLDAFVSDKMALLQMLRKKKPVRYLFFKLYYIFS